jgi:hypothetical protein
MHHVNKQKAFKDYVLWTKLLVDNLSVHFLQTQVYDNLRVTSYRGSIKMIHQMLQKQNFNIFASLQCTLQIEFKGMFWSEKTWLPCTPLCSPIVTGGWLGFKYRLLAIKPSVIGGHYASTKLCCYQLKYIFYG